MGSPVHSPVDGEHESGEQQPVTNSSDRWLFGISGLFAGLALALIAVLVWPSDDSAVTSDDVDSAIAQALAGQAQPGGAAEAYEQASPSVVGVRAISDGEEPVIGTGVIINDQGQILTANHVVFAADEIEIQFHDGSTSQARLESNEPALDIAVLTSQNQPATASPIALGNSRTAQIGDPVYAIGHPLGLSRSISAGIISGLGRSIPFPNADGLNAENPEGDSIVFENLIQFDAAINQGSSGGPLLNADGHVIAIVTALADPTNQGFFVGIGFAIPIDIAAAAAADGPSQ